jgi:hypothetical protein
MNGSIDGTRWSEYLETPCRKRQPVKLEHIVAQRIETFMKVKRAKLKDLQVRIDRPDKKL